MELSPLAKKRLARIGEPSKKEKETLKHSQDLSSLRQTPELFSAVVCQFVRWLGG